MPAPAGSAGGRRPVQLPDVPWDLLEPAKRRAQGHPGGLVDLSIGTPVDPVPEVVQAALGRAADAPGYPLTAGSPELRSALTRYVVERCGAPAVEGPDIVLPTIGSKELVAWLPTLLGLGPGDTVVIPTVCYPTYEVGARLAGATVLRADAPAQVPVTESVGLVWVNSPGNPDGRVLTTQELTAWVDLARARGAVLASDECYLELGWENQPSSVLAAVGGSLDGVLAVHSLSKRSNLAGYRAGFVAGDPALIADILTVRKHAGMIVPAPVQAAMIAALGDHTHVEKQRERYRRRRVALRTALAGAGFTVDHSTAGLYLWATRSEDCWSTVDWFAERGILVAAGAAYGPGGDRHVRIALTATDERIDAAVARLS